VKDETMTVQTIISCLFIALGSIVMMLSIAKFTDILKAIPFIPEKHQTSIRRYLFIHRGLMIFFLFGYIAVLVTFVTRHSPVSELYVGIIFLLGAVFVFLGTLIQNQLLQKIQLTLQGILPICAKCKKIRVQGELPESPQSWEDIENYIAKRTDVDFSHGYCPGCYGEEIKKINAQKKKR
jgi:hypothetical protein